jgi:hypothetical protein
MKTIVTNAKVKTYLRQRLEQLDAYESIYDALMSLARDRGAPEEVRIRALEAARKVVDSCAAMRDDAPAEVAESMSEQISKMLG